MQRIDLTSSLSLSRVIYGMWRLGDDSDTSINHIRNKIAACLEQGITTMDQADIYGGYMAEELLGQALQGTDLRNKIEIVTKCDIVAPVGRYETASVKYYDTSRAHILATKRASQKPLNLCAQKDPSPLTPPKISMKPCPNMRAT